MKTATSFPSGVTLLVDQTRTRWQASLRMPCWVHAYTCTDGKLENNAYSGQRKHKNERSLAGDFFSRYHCFFEFTSALCWC